MDIPNIYIQYIYIYIVFTIFRLILKETKLKYLYISVENRPLYTKSKRLKLSIKYIEYAHSFFGEDFQSQYTTLVYTIIYFTGQFVDVTSANKFFFGRIYLCIHIFVYTRILKYIYMYILWNLAWNLCHRPSKRVAS